MARALSGRSLLVVSVALTLSAAGVAVAASFGTTTPRPGPTLGPTLGPPVVITSPARGGTNGSTGGGSGDGTSRPGTGSPDDRGDSGTHGPGVSGSDGEGHSTDEPHMVDPPPVSEEVEELEATPDDESTENHGPSHG